MARARAKLVLLATEVLEQRFRPDGRGGEVITTARRRSPTPLKAAKESPLLPKHLVAALEQLVRDRDRWKRKALDRAAVTSKDRRREIAARDDAVKRLLFGIAIEGLASERHQTRGARGALWEAMELLRPDITATMPNGFDDAYDALNRFFPDE